MWSRRYGRQKCSLFDEKRGVYYFTRHVPNDLQRHYEKPRIVMCLKTRIQIAALKAIQSLKSKLDSFWLQMRISNMGVPVPCLLTKGQPYAYSTLDTQKKMQLVLRNIGSPDFNEKTKTTQMSWYIPIKPWLKFPITMLLSLFPLPPSICKADV